VRTDLRRGKQIAVKEHVDLKGKGTADDQDERCLKGIDCNCCFAEYPFVSYSIDLSLVSDMIRRRR
jgi:hypothetical protein